MAKIKTTKAASPAKKTAHEEFMEATCKTQCHDLRIALIESATKVVTASGDVGSCYVEACAFLKSWYESDTPQETTPPTGNQTPEAPGDAPSES